MIRFLKNSKFLFVLCILKITYPAESYNGCPFHHHQQFGRPRVVSSYYTSPYQKNNGPTNSGSSCVARQPRCNSSTNYYSYDGSCNNLGNPSWGQSGVQYNRLMPPNYADAKCALRKASNGQNLPMARYIRTTILEDREIPSGMFNVLFYAFGQWVDHDVTGFAPMTTQIDCCAANTKQSKSSEQSCLPLLIPERDQFYSQLGITCLSMRRSNNTHTMNCNLDKPCVPLNFQTPLLDLSVFYGPNQETVNDLRLFKGGLLKYTNDSMTNYQLFPPIANGITNCPQGGIDSRRGGYCLKAGDRRVNQNPELTVIELLFYKLHQRIATVLSNTFGYSSDEKIFQETRRLLIAAYQNIVYREFVPLTVGKTATQNFNLMPLEQGYAAYKPTVSPITLAEYAFSAGRAGHSQIRGAITYFVDKGYSKTYELRNKYFNQRFLLDKNMFENLVQAYARTDSNMQDEYGTQEITNYLLANETSSFGSDLLAVDILRGLDAGLPTYNSMRSKVGLHKLHYFEDLALEGINTVVINKLKSLYSSVEDMDLYVGGLLEKPIPDSSIGPTFTHIIAESFYRWKFGDRLYYEFREAGFSFDELNDLRKVTFAFLLCLVNPSQQVPLNAFRVPSYNNNPIMDCRKILENGPSSSKIWKTLRSISLKTRN